MEKLNAFFASVPEVDDLPDWISWFTSAPIADIQANEYPINGAIQNAMKMALDNGADSSNLDELYEASLFYYESEFTTHTAATKTPKPWEKINVMEQQQVHHQASAVPVTPKKEVLISEDLRNWPEEELEDKLLDLFDAAFKRHKLPFSLEESKEEIEKTIALVTSSEEAISQEDLARKVNNRYAGISRSRNASAEIRATCNGHKFSPEVFGKLKTMVRNDSFSEFIATTAARLEDEGLPPESVIAVLERTTYFGGDESGFNRAYTRIVGTSPVPVVSKSKNEKRIPATTPAATNIGAAMKKAGIKPVTTVEKKKPWQK